MRTEELEKLKTQIMGIIVAETGAEETGYYAETKTRRFEVRIQGKSYSPQAVRVVGHVTGGYHNERDPWFSTKTLDTVKEKLAKLVNDLDAQESRIRESAANAATRDRRIAAETGSMLSMLHAAGFTATTPYANHIEVKLVNFSICSAMHNQAGILALAKLLDGRPRKPLGIPEAGLS